MIDAQAERIGNTQANHMTQNIESVGFQNKKAVVSGVNVEWLSPGEIENAVGIVAFINDFRDAVKSGVDPSEYCPIFRKRADEMQIKTFNDDEKYRKETHFLVDVPGGGVTKEQLADLPAMIDVMYQMRDAVSPKHVEDAVQKLEALNAPPVVAVTAAVPAVGTLDDFDSRAGAAVVEPPATAPNVDLNRDRMTAQYFIMNLPLEMRPQQQIYHDVTEKILHSDVPPELQGKGLAAKADWWGENVGTKDEAKIAMELAFYSRERRFPPSQNHDPNDQLRAGSQSAAHNASNKTADMFDGAVNSLTSLVSSIASSVKNIGVAGRIERATEAAYQETVGGKVELDQGFQKLSDKVTALGGMAPGAARDALVKEITEGARSHMELADSVSKKEARISADPNSKSEFKRDKSEIDADVEDHGSKLSELLNKAKAAVPGDEKNTQALEVEQSKMKEMLERIKSMVKSIFRGFGADDAKTARPRQ